MVIKFSIDKPEYVDEDLCSVGAESTPQLAKPEEFGLFVSAFFGKKTENIELKDGTTVRLTYGISSAKLRVDTCDKSRVPFTSRYEEVAYKVTYKETTTNENAKGAEAGGNVAVSMPIKIPFIEAKAKAGGDWKSAITREAVGESEYVTSYKSVWKAGVDHWRIAATVPAGQEPVLEGDKLGKEPLCIVETPDGTAEVTVSLIVPFADVWLEVDSSKTLTPNPERDSNRSAVARALFAKRLKQRGHKTDPDAPDGEVILARSRMIRLPKEDKG